MPRRPEGSPRSGALPLTDKQELRETVTADNPIGAHLCAAATRSSASTPRAAPPARRAHPADRPRPRELGRRLGAQLRRLGRHGRPAPGLQLQRRAVRRRAALGAFDRIGLSQIPVGTGNTERLITAVELLRRRPRR